MQVEVNEKDKTYYSITYKGNQICLGKDWEEMIKKIGSLNLEGKILAAIKVCLYE